MRRALTLSALLCTSACVTTAPATTPQPPVESPSAQRTEVVAAREALTRFLEAAQAQRFDEVWPLLSRRWREASTSESLRDDFGAAPTAVGRLERLRGALDAGGVEVTGEEALVRLPGGLRARAVREAGAWHIDALEEDGG